MKSSRAFFVFFALFWSGITLAFDVMSARALLGQWRSTSFSATEGRILASEVVIHSDSESTSQGASVRYEYRVGGRRYESTRVRFGQMSTSDGKWANETVRTNPTGATRPVYYDPAAPGEAVLQTGISGADLFMALFLSPFNAIMLGLWWLVVSAWRPAPPLGGAEIRSEGGEVQVRFARVGPWAVALAAFGSVTLVVVLLTGLAFGFAPPLGAALGAWLIALAGSIGAAAWARQKRTQAQPDLIVSPERGTLTRVRSLRTPTSNVKTWRDWKRACETPLVVPLERIRDVVVRQQTTSDSNSLHYVVTLLVGTADSEAREEHALATWVLPEHAEAFAAWLRMTLGLG